MGMKRKTMIKMIVEAMAKVDGWAIKQTETQEQFRHSEKNLFLTVDRKGVVTLVTPIVDTFGWFERRKLRKAIAGLKHLYVARALFRKSEQESENNLLAIPAKKVAPVAAPVSDKPRNEATFTAGESIVPGDLVTRRNDRRMYVATAQDLQAGRPLGVATSNGNRGGSVSVACGGIHPVKASLIGPNTHTLFWAQNAAGMAGTPVQHGGRSRLYRIGTKAGPVQSGRVMVDLDMNWDD